MTVNDLEIQQSDVIDLGEFIYPKLLWKMHKKVFSKMEEYKFEVISKEKESFKVRLGYWGEQEDHEEISEEFVENMIEIFKPPKELKYVSI